MSLHLAIDVLFNPMVVGSFSLPTFSKSIFERTEGESVRICTSEALAAKHVVDN